MEQANKTQRNSQLWRNLDTGKYYYISDKGVQRLVKGNGASIPKFCCTVSGVSKSLRTLKKPGSIPKFPGCKEMILNCKKKSEVMKLIHSEKIITILSERNKKEFQSNSKIHETNHRRFSLSQALDGDTFRSVRQENKSREGSRKRRCEFITCLKKSKTLSQANLKKSLKSPAPHFKAARMMDNRPKTLEEYGKRNIKEFKHQNKLHNKRKVVKNKVIQDFFKKYKNPHMRRLANPFHLTPTEEYMLKNEIEMAKFIPNTSIAQKQGKKLNSYMSMDLVEISKEKIATPIKPHQKEDIYLNKLVSQNLKDTESFCSDDPRYGFDEDHKVASSDFVAKNYKDLKRKEEILKELDRKRNQKKRVPLEPDRFGDVKAETGGGLWMKDKEERQKVNPEYEQKERFYREKERRFLEQRRQGNVLKNLSLNQDLKIMNKKLDKMLRDKIF
ncbi:unnamed protein product [Moneuplotes crassus]|uniref:Uncharacterized protein n=1 Tax=Euplotes crassus TaxID=5936 RepID=A0AAD1X9L5_EUPCR|nr:unnamed protein product [Moneuplotes crassus]